MSMDSEFLSALMGRIAVARKKRPEHQIRRMFMTRYTFTEAHNGIQCWQAKLMTGSAIVVMRAS